MTEVTDVAAGNATAADIAPAESVGYGPPGDIGPTKFADPLRIPPVLRPRHGETLHVQMRAARQPLHSELPATPLWTYEGTFPGPTIEVQRAQRLWVAWSNRIDTAEPVLAVEQHFPPPQGPLPQPGNTPGRDGVDPRRDIADLPPWTVVHLHGGRIGGGSDGLPENAMLPGHTQLTEYVNDQQATALWYHDHAMDVTRFNVMGGLLGMYLIRDDEEAALGLPCGEQEVPLIICDRNLDTDEEGRLTGRLLHKVAALDVPDVPMKPVIAFFGPYTVVNGVIWPHLEVQPRWYRFRVLNASNARFYRLYLLDEDDNQLPGAIVQIGTDSGLLPAPLPLDGELTLAPAERADILIDFGAFRGRRLRLVSTGAGAVDVNPPIVPGQTDPEAGLVEPDVMQFRVGSEPVEDPFTLPETLSPSFVRLTHDSLPHDHGHRWIVSTPPTAIHPEIWEMKQIDPSTVTLPQEGVIQVRGADGEVVTLMRVARSYEEAASFMIEHDAWEQWKFLSLGGPSHPMHIHLIGFQAVSRDRYDVSTFDPVAGWTTAPVSYQGPGVLDPNEQGWKDTIRVGQAEVVSVAGRFGGGTGRFMYHCHILEHEDEGMMRAFLVMPGEVMALKPHMHDTDHHG